MILFMAATVWGVAFVAQSVGMDYVGYFTFVAVRNVVALAVLVPCVVVMDSSRRKRGVQEQVHPKENKRALAIGGICCGICLLPRARCSSLA